MKICKYNGLEYAYIIEADEEPENTTFYTPKKCDVQIGLVCHKKGYVEPAHVHMEWDRLISVTTETLHVIRGRCLIRFFDKNSKEVGKEELRKGDSIMLLGNTGHNLETLEDFKGFKTKQGPYINMQEDKIIL